MATILVVDDNPVNRKLLVALLSGDGYLTLEACDGADGLAAAHAHCPELIITDILMPTTHGSEFVHELRRDPKLRNTPVIFYTAHYHEREAHSLAQACGVSRVLVKPCPNAELLKAVEQVLAGMSESDRPMLPTHLDQANLRRLSDELSERAAALAASNARYTALADLNLEIATQRDPDALLERVCRGARELLGAQFAVLAVADDRAARGVFFTASGIDSDRLPLSTPDLHTGPLGRVLTERLPWRTCDADGDLQHPGLPFGFPRAHAYLAVPLATAAHIHGWLCLGGKLGAACFDDFDEKLLQMLGALAARSHENLALLAEIQRQDLRLGRSYALLGGIGALLARTQTVVELARQACRLCVDRGRYRLAFIEMAEARGADAACVAAAGEHAEGLMRRKFRERAERDDLVGMALSTEEPAICNDLSNTSLRIRQREEHVARGCHSMAVLPLRGCTLGRLVLLGERVGAFDAAEVKLLNEFAGCIAVALAQSAAHLAVNS